MKRAATTHLPTETSNTRRQATLFLPEIDEIEWARATFNPEQAKLIRAHVTLLREDEVADWKQLETTIRALLPIELTLRFGPPQRVGNFVALSAIEPEAKGDSIASAMHPTGGNPGDLPIDPFNLLRRQLLVDSTMPIRRQDAHITIIHPRNGHCTDSIFQAICERIQPFTYIFRHISLIEQTDHGVWQTLAVF